MISAIVIRTASQDDIAAIDAMMRRSYPRLLAAAYPPSTLVLACPVIARAQPVLVASGTYFVAEDADQRILGAGGWSRGDPQGRLRLGVGHVRHFATDADRIRSGVGRRLLERCMTDARAAGLRRLDCISTLNAVPFYAASGFAVVAETVLQLGPGIDFPAIRMSRGLT